jgi:thiamine-phosphate pyrophosphorylase
MAERCLLYYITDRSAFPGDDSDKRKRLLEKISEAATAGVDYIQLREKDLPTRALESLAREAVIRLNQLKAVDRDLKTALLINSRTDIAMAVQAGGVHLRSDDVYPQEVRAIWKQCEYECGAGAPAREIRPRLPLIGVSCHSPAEVAEAADNQASFAVFAPVFAKKGVSPAGLNLLREACRINIPVLALGGITLSNAHSCLEAGAAGIAAIRLFQENNIATVMHQLRSNS